MKWSNLPGRKKQLYVSVGVLAVAFLFSLSIVNGNRQQVGADTDPTSTDLSLDTNPFDTAQEVQLQITKGGTGVAADIDFANVATNEAGYIPTDPEGKAVIAADRDSCTAVRAIEAEGTAETTVILQVGSPTTECEAGTQTVIEVPANSTEAVTINLQ